MAEFPHAGPEFRSFYKAAGLSSDGKLAIGSEKSEAIAVLDAQGQPSVRIFDTKGKADGSFDHLIFSPDSHYLIALGKSTLVWDLTAKEPKGPVAKLPAAITCGFSADGKTLALDNIGCITLWRVGEWKMLPQSADPVSPVNRVKFVADGKKVLGYTHNSLVKLADDGRTNYSDIRCCLDGLR